ncbi:MAG: hypothetical protein ABEJ58_10500 [Halodesulfurarchaeum sp.]
MAESPETVGGVLRRRTRVRDCLLLAAVPVVLIGVFLLPESVRQSFVFVYSDPTLLRAYTAHFVHLSRSHLLANLLAYGLLATFGYLLALLGRRRRLFGVALLTYLLAFPPVLSALNLAIPRDAVGYGFSGINMAIVGLFPVLLFEMVGRHVDVRIETRHSPMLFFAGISVIAGIGLPRVPISLGIVTASLLATTLYGLSLVDSLPSRGTWAPSVRERSWPSGWGDLVALGLVLYVGMLFVAFPHDPQSGMTTLNTYVHLLAFSLGFQVPYLGIELGLFGRGYRPGPGEGE